VFTQAGPRLTCCQELLLRGHPFREHLRCCSSADGASHSSVAALSVPPVLSSAELSPASDCYNPLLCMAVSLLHVFAGNLLCA